jgi:hypothetical protein
VKVEVEVGAQGAVLCGPMRSYVRKRVKGFQNHIWFMGIGVEVQVVS